MTIAYFKFELNQFFSNRKNLFVYLLVFMLSLFYCFRIEDNFVSKEAISKNKLEVSINAKQELLDSTSKQKEVDPHIASIVPLLPELIKNEQNQLEFIKNKNYEDLASERSKWYFLTIDPYNPLYFKNQINPSNEAFYHMNGMSKKLSDYNNTDYKITINVLNEKTAIQSLIRIMSYTLPYVLLIVSLIFSMDIFSKDRNHISIISGIPVNDSKKILIKLLVILIGLFLTLIPISIGFLWIGFTNGFGNMTLPVAVTNYVGKNPLNGDLIFDTMTTGQFIGKFFILMFLLVIIIIMFSFLLGFWIKNSYILLVVMLGLPFADLFYNRPGYGNIHQISYLPTSYVRTGDVISGYRSFFLSDTNLTFSSGLVVLGVTLVLLALALFITSINKRII